MYYSLSKCIIHYLHVLYIIYMNTHYLNVLYIIYMNTHYLNVLYIIYALSTHFDKNSSV